MAELRISATVSALNCLLNWRRVLCCGSTRTSSASTDFTRQALANRRGDLLLVGGQGRAKKALDALRGRRLETQLMATRIHCRPHAIQGAVVSYHLTGQPVEELVGILNTRLTEAESLRI